MVTVEQEGQIWKISSEGNLRTLLMTLEQLFETSETEPFFAKGTLHISKAMISQNQGGLEGMNLLLDAEKPDSGQSDD